MNFEGCSYNRCQCFIGWLSYELAEVFFQAIPHGASEVYTPCSRRLHPRLKVVLKALRSLRGIFYRHAPASNNDTGWLATQEESSPPQSAALLDSSPILYPPGQPSSYQRS